MRLSLFIVFLYGLTGCAFNDVPLDMPISGLKQSIEGGNKREVVVVVPFQDDRFIKDRCGMQKNGYNMDTADAICKTAPATWIGQLLADELRASGFTILKSTDSNSSDALKIEGSLIKLFVEPVIGFWSGSLETDIDV